MAKDRLEAVGVIGLGIIGSRVVGVLRASGHEVAVWNRTKQSVAGFCGSALEVVRVVKVVQLFVADEEALMGVLEAMGQGLTMEHVVICSATVGPEATMRAAKFVEERGARFLDAPFTGSKLAAEKGQLVYYIGGEEAVLERVRGILEASSRAMVRIGGVGQAATVKVVTNLISAVTVGMLAEGLRIMEGMGMDGRILEEALVENACRSGVTDMKLPKMISGDFEAHFSLKHMLKDVEIGESMAKGLGVEAGLTGEVGAVLREAVARGKGDWDYSALHGGKGVGERVAGDE